MKRPYHVVNRRSKNEFDIILIDLDDVIYTGIRNGERFLQTQQGTYYHISKSEEHERFYEFEGLTKVDRCFWVDKNKVEFYDEQDHKLYFQPEPVGKDAPSAPVANAHLHVIADVRRGSANGDVRVPYRSKPEFS